MCACAEDVITPWGLSCNGGDGSTLGSEGHLEGVREEGGGGGKRGGGVREGGGEEGGEVGGVARGTGGE